ncbi:unnamed protein product [Cyprideis torosa]|uniref:Uncharacterized protein n=1 Tax=Cyprideis torosa TaxID=163714 RepID=A0A7R8WLJ1_9CRUS|nr:unnamed protein product [Cyprideis torosa]CAG0901654.1 unnamed protein product [Cyprideis torosa]
MGYSLLILTLLFCFGVELVPGQRGGAGGQCGAIACPANFDPVCGTDGRTYSNECNLEAERRCNNPRLFVASRGECRRGGGGGGGGGGQCGSIACPYNYDPVCGSDGNTYPNECSLRAERCNNPRLFVVYKGQCSGGGGGRSGRGRGAGANSFYRFVFSKEQCGAVACPAIFTPVCGTDGKTYPNECTLQAKQRCSDPDLFVASRGECRGGGGGGGSGGIGFGGAGTGGRQCAAIPCPANFDPVCGSDGKTYPNECSLEAERRCNNPRLSVASRGECRGGGSGGIGFGGAGLGERQCAAIPCPANFDPVCGSDGKTYPNECSLEAERRCNNPRLSVASRGECRGGGSGGIGIGGAGNGGQCGAVACPLNLDPVCGSNGRTYPNECSLEAERRCNDPRLFVASRGRCRGGAGNGGDGGGGRQNLCSRVRCARDEVCIVQEVQCFRAPCPPPTARCVLRPRP